MKIAIVGGKLQGTEAVYLASACGFESILIDANPSVQAGAMADRFVCGDIVKREEQVINALKEADFCSACKRKRPGAGGGLRHL